MGFRFEKHQIQVSQLGFGLLLNRPMVLHIEEEQEALLLQREHATYLSDRILSTSAQKGLKRPTIEE